MLINFKLFVFQYVLFAVEQLKYFTMKVAGDVEIVNRLLSSTGMRSKGRCSRAQLGIGHSGPSGSREAALLICTQQDRAGTKYIVSEIVILPYSISC